MAQERRLVVAAEEHVHHLHHHDRRETRRGRLAVERIARCELGPEGPARPAGSRGCQTYQLTGRRPASRARSATRWGATTQRPRLWHPSCTARGMGELGRCSRTTGACSSWPKALGLLSRPPGDPHVDQVVVPGRESAQPLLGRKALCVPQRAQIAPVNLHASSLRARRPDRALGRALRSPSASLAQRTCHRVVAADWEVREA